MDTNQVVAPKVSLIISFYQKINDIKLVIASLEKQTFKDFEVIIADDGSQQSVVDEIKNIKTSFPLIHIWHPDNGWQKSVIVNKAILEASAEYLIFTDSDCILHPRFIEEHYQYRNEKRVISGRRVMLTENVSNDLTPEIVQSNYMRMIVPIRLFFEYWVGGKKVYLRHTLHLSNRFLRKLFIKEVCRGFWGCNFSTYRKNILAVNGFDERFLAYGGEDADLDMRLRTIGVKPYTLKYLVTQYHIYHVQSKANNAGNNSIIEGHKKGEIPFYTPYGIEKKKNSNL